MTEPSADAALNVASRRRKMMVIGNILVWLIDGVYTVSPIDLVPDVIPLLGFADDLLGFLIAIAFTIYTVRTLRQKGVQGLMPSNAIGGRDALALTQQSTTEDTPTIVDMKVEGTDRYEPIPPDKIKSL
jgi:uncharacterized membrane protein YkvA (DUF1232 family)